MGAQSLQELTNAWKKLNLNSKGYILDGDNLDESKCWNIKNYNDFIQRQTEIIKDKKRIFHTGLLPVPFSGDIKNAVIYILLLNPGLSAIDYYVESNEKSFRNQIINKLKKDKLDRDYPFISLNPKYLWTGGGRYWTNKFMPIIKELMKHNKSYLEILQLLSKNIAALELIPYHSKNLSMTKKLQRQKSVVLMKSFVKEYVLRKAKNDKAIIIVTRQIKSWGLKKEKNVYLMNNPRNISFNTKTREGKVILNKLLKSI